MPGNASLFSLMEIADLEYIRCSLQYTIITPTLPSVAIYRNTSIRKNSAFFPVSTLTIYNNVSHPCTGIELFLGSLTILHLQRLHSAELDGKTVICDYIWICNYITATHWKTIAWISFLFVSYFRTRSLTSPAALNAHQFLNDELQMICKETSVT